MTCLKEEKQEKTLENRNNIQEMKGFSYWEKREREKRENEREKKITKKVFALGRNK